MQPYFPGVVFCKYTHIDIVCRCCMATQKLLQHDTESNSSSLSCCVCCCCCFFRESNLKVSVILTQCDKPQTTGWRANLHVLAQLHQPPDRIVVLFLPNHKKWFKRFTVVTVQETLATSHANTLKSKHSHKSLICELPTPILTYTCYYS